MLALTKEYMFMLLLKLHLKTSILVESSTLSTSRQTTFCSCEAQLWITKASSSYFREILAILTTMTSLSYCFRKLSSQFAFVLKYQPTKHKCNRLAVRLESICTTKVGRTSSFTLLCHKWPTLQTFQFVLKAMTALQLLLSTNSFCLQSSPYLRMLYGRFGLNQKGFSKCLPFKVLFLWKTFEQFIFTIFSSLLYFHHVLFYFPRFTHPILQSWDTIRKPPRTIS